MVTHQEEDSEFLGRSENKRKSETLVSVVRKSWQLFLAKQEALILGATWVTFLLTFSLQAPLLSYKGKKNRMKERNR